MIVTSAPDVTEYYIQKMNDFLDGKSPVMNRVFGGTRTRIHLSDLTAPCLIQVLYNRLGRSGPRDREATLKFFTGRALESFIAEELDPKEKDGIIFTVDDSIPQGLVEIKGTRYNCDTFNADKPYEEWLTRMKGYCYGYGVKHMYLFAMFYVGNLIARRVDWENRKTVDARTWKYLFTPEELVVNWDMMLQRKCLLTDAIGAEGLTEDIISYVKIHKPQWVCKLCDKSHFCEFYKKFET